MKKGDIVLVPFPFSDLTGNKKRPAIVLIDSEDDVTICFITTHLKWKSKYDVTLQPSKNNGLKKTSLIRINKIATVDKDLLIGLIGQLDRNDLSELNDKLIEILKLYSL